MSLSVNTTSPTLQPLDGSPQPLSNTGAPSTPVDPTQPPPLTELDPPLPDDGADGVTESNGMPRLAEPNFDFGDCDELALLLTRLDSSIRDAQGRLAAISVQHGALMGQGAFQNLGSTLTGMVNQVAQARAQERADQVMDWTQRLTGLAAAVADQAAKLPAPQKDKPGSQPLLADAVQKALGVGGTAPSDLDALLPPELRQSQGLQTPDGQPLDLGVSLHQADLEGAKAEQLALASGQPPEVAARLRLAVSVAAFVSAVKSTVNTVTGALGQAPLPGAQAAPPAVDPKDIGGSLKAQSQAASTLSQQTGAAASQTHANAVQSALAAQAARQLVLQTGSLVQLLVADLLRHGYQLQVDSGAVQNAGDEGAGVNALGVSHGLQRDERLRGELRALQQHLAERQTEQADQEEKLRDLVQALQQGGQQVLQLLQAAADPRMQARHVVRA